MTYYETAASLVRPYSRYRRRQIARLFVENLRPRAGRTLIDIGGPGIVSGFLAARGLKVTAVNVNLEHLHQQLPIGDELVQRVVGDARELPFADGSFDYVLSDNVLEHIPLVDRVRYRDELERVARRGYLVTTPNYWFPVEPHTMIPLHQFWVSVTHSDVDNPTNAVLLSRSELRSLFPRATVTSLGMIPKVPETLTAWRADF